MLGAKTCWDGRASVPAGGLDGARSSSELEGAWKRRAWRRQKARLSSRVYCHIYRSPYPGNCVGRRARPGKAELKFIGARNFVLEKTKALDREVSGGVACAGIGQKMGGREEREGEGGHNLNKVLREFEAGRHEDPW